MNLRTLCSRPGGLLALVSLLFIALPVLEAQTPPPAPPPRHDLLTEALPALQSGYVNYAALQVKPMDRLEDLVARSHGQIELEAPPTKPSSVPALLTELLPGQIVYWRCSAFQTAADGPALAAQDGQWKARGAAGFILDLRDTSDAVGLEGAREIAGQLAPAGAPLFTVETAREKVVPLLPATPAPLTGPMVVLVDHRTAGLAEALAAGLKARGALVIGQTTSGKGGVFTEQKLSEGQTLRYLTGQLVLGDGTLVSNHPVIPDIALTLDDARENAALDLIAQNRISQLIAEPTERHRLSEATLVRGEDPEIDSLIVSNIKKTPQVPQDEALIAAMDSLKAIRLSQARSSLPSPEAAAPSAVR